MSRIGRKPIVLPKGVKVAEQERVVSVTGPRGSLSLDLTPAVSIRLGKSEVLLERSSDDRLARAHHGLMRNLIANMVTGVSTGFEKKLEIVGVGFKAEVSGNQLRLNLGYSHPVILSIPQGIEVLVEKQTRLSVRGIDAQKVGQFAADIRKKRLPDAYKGKGIRYDKEVIKLKAGKTAISA